MAEKGSEIGLECARLGINKLLLLSFTSKAESVQHLPEISLITNGLMIELLHFKNKYSECTYRSMYRWTQDLYGRNWPAEPAPTLQAFTKSIERLQAKLNKQHSGDEKKLSLDYFLKEEYTLPKIGLCNGRVLHFSPAKQACTTSRLPTEEAAQGKSHAAEYKEIQKKMYAVTRNANKKLKRRDALIHSQKEQIQSQTKVITKFQRNVDGMEAKLAKLKAEIGRVSHRASYWKAKALVLREGNTEKSKELHQEIDQLKETVSSLDLHNVEMRETIDNILSNEEEITTFEGGKYTDNVRACIYELLSLNVGVKKIAPAIRCVLKNVAQKSVSRLPSYGLTCQMIAESLTIAQAQLGKTLSDETQYAAN